MKVKTKLLLALSLLFVVLLLVGGVGILYLNWLAADSRAIMQENYRSLVYMQQLSRPLNRMQSLLPRLPYDPESQEESRQLLEEMATALSLQERNITESGESELTRRLSGEFEKLGTQMVFFLERPDSMAYLSEKIIPQIYRLEEQIDQVYLLNEEALVRKNRIANSTASRVTLYMGVVTLASLLIGLLYLFGLPAYVSGPLVRLNEAIMQIAQRNYQQELPVASQDEFGDLARSFNRMAGKLREYEQSNFARLLFEKKRLDAVIHQLRDPIIGLDAEKRVLFANTHALQLLGLSSDRLVGQYAPDVAAVNPLLRRLISGLMEEETGLNAETRSESLKIVEDGKERLFVPEQVRVTGQLDGQDEEVLVGFVLGLNDITEFAERDLAKTHFMAVLSHELKTPVAAIFMSSQLLRGETDPSQQKMLIDTIDDNVERIRRMIGELIDVSRIETGSVDLHLSPTAPEAVLRRAVAGVDVFLAEKQLRIQERIQTGIPDLLLDPHKMVWVLNNFLTNAIRYSPPGTALEISLLEKNGECELAIGDSGPGISPENQQRIFQRFQRIRDDKTEGTGLGLAISKEFVEAMGGRIGVDSQIGQGSRFWVRFPMPGQR